MERAGSDVHLDLPRTRIDMGRVPHRTSVSGLLARYSLGHFEPALVRHTIKRFLQDLRETDIAWIWPAAPLEVYETVAERNIPILMEGINTRIANARRILERVHAGEGLPPPFDTSQGLPEADEERVLALASYFFAPSPLVAEAVTAPDSSFRGQVLPTSYGAWVNDGFRPDRENRTGLLKVLFMGSVCVRKNAHGLLRAWSRLAPRNAKLVLCGHVENHVSRLCATELSLPSVEVRGHVKDVRAAYAEADVFVMPSFEEGSPQVTFEAATFGLPLIVSPMGDGGISSQGRETAYPIDPHSVTSITDALETFLSDAALRAEYGDRSYSIAPEFDWNEVGRKRAKALNEACAGTTIRSLR